MRFPAPVSVVIPCYCCHETIGRAVASIAAQTVRPVEVILVEDASPDGGDTLATLWHLAEEYADVFNTRIIAVEENSGPASARNRGWEVASQPYIAFLDADDAWRPQKIEIQYGWMVCHAEFGLVGHGYSSAPEEESSSTSRVSAPAVRRVTKFAALVSNPFATPTVMLKRDLPLRFVEAKRYAEDYLLWLQIILSGIPAAYVDMQLAATFKEDFGSGGLSAHLWKMEAGVQDTYRRLYEQRAIGVLAFLLISVYSMMKYVRRLFVVALRRMKD